jgi:TrmH family RNA methyltransferase
LQHLRELIRSRHERRASGTYVLEGRRSVDQAIELGVPIEALFVTEERIEWYDQFAYPLRRVSTRRLTQISSLTTCDGVLGIAPLTTCDFEELVSRSCILVPIGLQDPGNLGTLLRSALAFFDSVGLVLGPATADPFAPKVVRATTGLVGAVAIHEVREYEACLDKLGQAGVRRLALVPRAPEPMSLWPTSTPLALLVGSEAQGIEEGLLAHCDGALSIPQRAEVESLNAGVAGSIALFLCAGGTKS